MKLVVERPYKSFKPPFEWDIPHFGVLTGLNGSGKTQLLEVIDFVIRRHNGYGKIKPTAVFAHTCLFLPRGWEIPSDDSYVSHEQIAHRIQEASQQIKVKYDSDHPYHEPIAYARSHISQATGKDYTQLTDEEIQANCPPYLVARLLLGKELSSHHLAFSIRLYHFQKQSLILHHARDKNVLLTDEDIEARLGVPPWELFNRYLAAVGILYRVSSPDWLNIEQSYRLRLIGPEGLDLSVQDLSSGERFLFAIATLLFNARAEGRALQLLLMDEPDSHLHPAVINHVLGALRGIGKEFGCRIVLSTHRPDTIALCNAEDIWEVYRDEPRLRPCSSKAETIARLSANVLAVLPNIKCVLVEDEDDAAFYGATVAILTNENGHAFFPLPVFQPASTKNKSGGKTVVRGWVRKLANANLEGLVVGLIDGDADNTGAPGITVLPRYAIENYLFDPLLVYSKLIEEGTAPTIDGICMTRGDEHKLRAMTQQQLQRIADTICGPITDRLDKYDGQRFAVKFETGQMVQYPTWLKALSADQLQAKMFAIYDPLGGLGPMLRTYERVKMVPTELTAVLKNVVS